MQGCPITLPATIVLGLHQVKMATFMLLHNLVLITRSLGEGLKSSEGGNFGKLGVMAGDRLDQSAQVGPRHAKHKRPIVLRIQIAIGQYEEALIGLRSQLVSHDDIEQVLRVELLSLRVQPYPRFYQLIDLQVLKVQLNWWILIACTGQTREKDLDMVDELVDEPLVERVSKEGLLRPKLDYLDFLDPRQSTIL